MNMSHLVLLGDSIFDNGRYTGGGPDVVSQVRGILPPGWDTTLLAIDGSTTDNVADQMQRLPRGATHLVLSVGGNNALMCASKLGLALFGVPASAAASALDTMADVSDDFEARYRSAVIACLLPGLPLSVCTIYDGNFPDKAYQRIASLGLTMFNDVILRVAIENRLPVIDLRLICANPEDYANAIEPSSVGGEKIAKVIVAIVTGACHQIPATRVYAAHAIPALKVQ
jgi:hypothetical protein